MNLLHECNKFLAFIYDFNIFMGKILAVRDAFFWYGLQCNNLSTSPFSILISEMLLGGEVKTGCMSLSLLLDSLKTST